jgi:hypothetical protein
VGDPVIIRFGKHQGKRAIILKSQLGDAYTVKIEDGPIQSYSGKGLALAEGTAQQVVCWKKSDKFWWLFCFKELGSTTLWAPELKQVPATLSHPEQPSKAHQPTPNDGSDPWASMTWAMLGWRPAFRRFPAETRLKAGLQPRVIEKLLPLVAFPHQSRTGDYGTAWCPLRFATAKWKNRHSGNFVLVSLTQAR